MFDKPIADMTDVEAAVVYAAYEKRRKELTLEIDTLKAIVSEWNTNLAQMSQDCYLLKVSKIIDNREEADKMLERFEHWRKIANGRRNTLDATLEMLGENFNKWEKGA